MDFVAIFVSVTTSAYIKHVKSCLSGLKTSVTESEMGPEPELFYYKCSWNRCRGSGSVILVTDSFLDSLICRYNFLSFSPRTVLYRYGRGTVVLGHLKYFENFVYKIPLACIASRYGIL